MGAAIILTCVIHKTGNGMGDNRHHQYSQCA